MTRHNTISSLQGQLKSDILSEINNTLMEVCIETVEKYLERNVYSAYTPSGEFAYDRTMDLYNSVTVDNVKVGYKYATFEVYMDAEKINSNVTDSPFEWNQHASVDPVDVSEYIPLWVEEGTSGSLWDRDGAYYMHDSYMELSDGDLAMALAQGLRSRGWNVITVS